MELSSPRARARVIIFVRSSISVVRVAPVIYCRNPEAFIVPTGRHGGRAIRSLSASVISDDSHYHRRKYGQRNLFYSRVVSVSIYFILFFSRFLDESISSLGLYEIGYSMI